MPTTRVELYYNYLAESGAAQASPRCSRPAVVSATVRASDAHAAEHGQAGALAGFVEAMLARLNAVIASPANPHNLLRISGRGTNRSGSFHAVVAKLRQHAVAAVCRLSWAARVLVRHVPASLHTEGFATVDEPSTAIRRAVEGPSHNYCSVLRNAARRWISQPHTLH